MGSTRCCGIGFASSKGGYLWIGGIMLAKITGILAILFSTLLLATYRSAKKERSDQPEGASLINTIDGRELYRSYCAVCHGKNGKGDGPTAKALKIPPTDLTRISKRNAGRFPLDRVQRVIAAEEA